MSTIPILLAIVGIGLLIWEVWSFRFVRRAWKAGRLPRQWRRRRIIAFIVGGFLALTTLWQGYPIGGGNAAGIPFFAAWFDA